MNAELIKKIIDKHEQKQGGLIPILEDIQAEYSYLPSEALKLIAELTDRSLVDIYGVATFYKSFSLVPRGEHLISVCLGTACHVRGAPAIVDEFERQLSISTGQTTSDKKFSLETVNCLGACALGPIVVVDGHYFSNVSTSKVAKIIEKAEKGLDETETKQNKSLFPVEVTCPRCNHSLMDKDYEIDGYPSIRLTMSYGQKHGWLRLSSLYGSYNIKSEYTIPEKTVVHIFCPHCNAELIGAMNCPLCDAAMIPMPVKGGAIVQICSRRGCKNHSLDLRESIL